MASYKLLVKSSLCQEMMILGIARFTNQLYWLLELIADETTTKAAQTLQHLNKQGEEILATLMFVALE